MDFLRLLWAPFAGAGRAFARYWLGAPAGDRVGMAFDPPRSQARRLSEQVESTVTVVGAVLLLALVGAALAGAALLA